MTDKEFLNWLADRLVNVYNESPNVDFVHKLKKIAENIEKTYEEAYEEGYADSESSRPLDFLD